MTTLNGHFDGKHIVLDDPIPPTLAPNTPVTISFPVDGERTALDDLADLAQPGGMPPDFAEQHDHYVKGLPKR